MFFAFSRNDTLLAYSVQLGLPLCAALVLSPGGRADPSYSKPAKIMRKGTRHDQSVCTSIATVTQVILLHELVSISVSAHPNRASISSSLLPIDITMSISMCLFYANPSPQILFPV